MRKSSLHPVLQKRCVPVVGKQGTFAVVPPPPPMHVDVPNAYGLLYSASQALNALQAEVSRNPKQVQTALSILNRQEAVESSQIEGTRTDLEGLLIHETQDGEPVYPEDVDADLTLNYAKAYSWGEKQVRERGKAALDGSLIKEIHQQLMSGQNSAGAGEFRDKQNWIGGLRIENAHFIPPPPDHLNACISDLQKLLQYEPEDWKSPHVLVRAAIAHAQFEAIHPFLDGNGRTGRILIPLMLVAEGHPSLHLASFLKLQQREYYASLARAQQQLDWEPWLTLFLKSAIASCNHSLAILDELDAIEQRWKGLLDEHGIRRDAAARAAIPTIMSRPVVSVNFLRNALGVSFPTANNAINLLEKIGILIPTDDQKRNRTWGAIEVLQAPYRGLQEALDQVSEIGAPLTMPRNSP